MNKKQLYEISCILYKLPLSDDIITNILLYDEHFAFVNGEFVIIQKLNKKDKRYSILIRKRPLIFISKNNYLGFEFSIINKYFYNSITIYADILDKSIFEQYNYIYNYLKKTNSM